MATERLDVLVAARGLAESRDQAQRLIRAGQVKVDGGAAPKPGHRVAADARLELVTPPRFVSRGGEKLDAAFAAFGLDVRGRLCLDVGASTGGFTDCMLQRGAARVIAVDVGRGQLHWRLRQDPRVTVLEGVNARYLAPAHVPEAPEFATVDVSFISLKLVLLPVVNVLAARAGLVTLVKPQFEAGRERVERGGVVRDEGVRRAVVAEIRAFGERRPGLRCRGEIASPLRGPAGNVEFLLHWEKGGPEADNA